MEITMDNVSDSEHGVEENNGNAEHAVDCVN
jgi:hypothetical protein